MCECPMVERDSLLALIWIVCICTALEAGYGFHHEARLKEQHCVHMSLRGIIIIRISYAVKYLHDHEAMQ